jgi:hypothetical protein
MADDDRAARRIAEELRREPPLDEAMDHRVMALIRGHGPVAPRAGRVARLRDWLLQPRTVQISPLSALGFAVVLLVLIAAGVSHMGPAVLSPVADGTTAEPQWVRFVFTAPGAARVSLVGDFNDWDAAATPLHPTMADGVWTVSVPLDAGRHEYAFVIDGDEWKPDPSAPLAARSDFGAPNSVVTVAEQL